MGYFCLYFQQFYSHGQESRAGTNDIFNITQNTIFMLIKLPPSVMIMLSWPPLTQYYLCAKSREVLSVLLHLRIAFQRKMYVMFHSGQTNLEPYLTLFILSDIMLSEVLLLKELRPSSIKMFYKKLEEMFPLICTNLSKMITTMINIAIIRQPTSAPAMVATATTIREGAWSGGGAVG